VALWLYATVDGVGSARELDRLCERDAPYRWLAGGVSLNHLPRDNQDETAASIRMRQRRGWSDGARAEPERRTAKPGGAFSPWASAVWRS